MANEDTLLRYFYKQSKSLSLEKLFEKFGVDGNILKPINYLVDNDWIEELDTETWQITDEGKSEFERRRNIGTVHQQILLQYKGMEM